MKYKIIVDKQSRTNPSEEKREYEIDIEELRCKGDVYDSLVITKDEDYVMRRLSLSDLHVLKVLDEPVKEPLADINIELFEGDNYIYLVDMTGNKFYAEYLVKNDFTDLYVTTNQMNTAINQSASQIELTVNQKLEGYSDTTEMNSAITQKANEITSTVSKIYATKTELSTAKSEIKQTTDSISSTVSKKVGNDEIISKINQSAEAIQINADKISIEGKAVNFSTEFSETFGPFTDDDVTKALKYIVGNTTLTAEELEKYDLNADGAVTTVDVSLIRRAIKNGGYITEKGFFAIDPTSAKRSIILKDEEGNVITSMGYKGIQTESIGCNSLKSSGEIRGKAVNIKSDDDIEESSFSNSITGNLIIHGRLDVERLFIGSGYRIPAIKYGSVNITPSAPNTPTGIVVEAVFNNKPIITATPCSTLPGTQVLEVGVQNVTNSSFMIYITRTNTVETTVHWQAIAED